MEIDHIFICAKINAPEAEALKSFGLTEGSPNNHPGQGTANRRFFFHNTFIELLWLHDANEAQNDITRPTFLHERFTLKDGAASPFGICFRPCPGDDKSVPFAARPYRPAYLPAGMEVSIGEGTPLSEPMWFYLSFATRPDNAPSARRQPLTHPIGFFELTSVRITRPSTEQKSGPAMCAIETTRIELFDGNEHLLELGFDGETLGNTHDFRPGLPLILRW